MNASVYLVSFLIIIFIVMIVSAVITFKITKKGLYEKVKLDITLEDMKQSEDRINNFLKENNLEADQSIFETEKGQYFIFAHEITHLINGDEIPATRPDCRHKSKMEQLADYTAAALLMPRDAIYDYLENNKYRQASVKKRMEMLKELCKKYNVTEVIALRRIEEVYVLEQNYR